MVGRRNEDIDNMSRNNNNQQDDEDYERNLREENGDYDEDESSTSPEIANRLRQHFREQIINEGVEESSSGSFLEALEEMGLIRELAPYIEADPQSPLPRIRIRSSSNENLNNNEPQDGVQAGIMIDIDIEMPDGVLAH
jgi:hypothetical protein